MVSELNSPLEKKKRSYLRFRNSLTPSISVTYSKPCSTKVLLKLAFSDFSGTKAKMNLALFQHTEGFTFEIPSPSIGLNSKPDDWMDIRS